MRRAISAVAVVVPARDEQELLPACLDALALAKAAVRVAVRIFVVLDRCTDATATVVAQRPDVVAVTSGAGCVGAARRLGTHIALQRFSRSMAELSGVWIASTDADSRVPPGWLAHQVQLANDGVDLVLGTVDLPPSQWSDPPAAAWRHAYGRFIRPSGTHSHVHGANLGVRASAYLAVGGFAAVDAHEDVLLAHALAAVPGTSVLTTVALPVTTSGRLVGRAPRGVAADLRELHAGSDSLRITG